ncbi:hypothetical protein ACTFIV_004300 [Dictyostelium citrinum]
MVNNTKNKQLQNKYSDHDQNELKLQKKQKNSIPKEKREHIKPQKNQQPQHEPPLTLEYHNENEKLFWKVMKNKYIKSIIYSFLHDGSNIQNKIYKYDEICSVQFLIENNLIELLKYKVKRGECLIDFLPILNKKNNQKYTPPPPQPNEDLIERKSIFKIIKNDTEFYQHLFRNYNQNFISNEKTFLVKGHTTSTLSLQLEDDDKFDLKIETKKQIIKDDNECAFKIFQNINSIQATADDFYESISKGSIKIAKLVYNQLKKELNFKKHEITAKVWKNYTFLNSNSPMFKDYIGTSPSPALLLNSTYSSTSFSSSSSSISSPPNNSIINNKKLNTINKSTNLLLLHLKLIPPKEMNNINQDIFKIEIKNLKVKKLLESCKTISIILQHTNLFDGYIKTLKKKDISDKYMGFEGELQTYLPNPSIDFLCLDKLIEIEQNLKTQSMESYVHSIIPNDHNNNVFKLYKMLLTFTDYSTVFRDNYLFFKCKYFNDFSLCKSAIDKQLAYQLGSFENVLPNSSHLSNLFQLFSFCQNEKETQIKFINQAIDNIIQCFKDSKKPLIKPLDLITTLLHFDWIEMISIFYKNLKDIVKDEKQLIPTNIIDHIKSTTAFDFYVNNNLITFNNHQINLNNCLMKKSSFNEQQPLNLMNHIKKNHNKIYKELINSIDITINDPINYTIESLLFIYNNINDFQYCYDRINVWKRDNIHLSLNQFIQLVNCTPINKKYNYLCGNGSTHILDQFNFDSCLLKYNWVINNKHHDILSNRCDGYYESKVNGLDPKFIIILYQYYNYRNLILNDIFPRLDSLDPIVFNTPSTSVVFKITSAIGERCDLKSLEIILKLMDFSSFNSAFLNYFYTNFLFLVTSIALKNGHFKIFQYLKSNYPFLFDIKISFSGNENNLESFRSYQINILFDRLRDISVIYNLVDFFNELKNNIFFDHFNK